MVEYSSMSVSNRVCLSYPEDLFPVLPYLSRESQEVLEKLVSKKVRSCVFYCYRAKKFLDGLAPYLHPRELKSITRVFTRNIPAWHNQPYYRFEKLGICCFGQQGKEGWMVLQEQHTLFKNGTSTIALAFNTLGDFGERFCCKQIRPGIFSDREEAIIKYMQETRDKAPFKFRNVIATRYLQPRQHYEPLLCVQEFGDKGNLEEFRAEIPKLPLEQRESLAMQLLQALVDLHSQGIVHRDMKPHNIVIQQIQRKHGQVKHALKVVDFDRADKKPYTRGDIVGTCGYLPPETLFNYGLSPSADVWSAAVVIFVLLTGKEPPTLFKEWAPLLQREKITLEQDVVPFMRKFSQRTACGVTLSKDEAPELYKSFPELAERLCFWDALLQAMSHPKEKERETAQAALEKAKKFLK